MATAMTGNASAKAEEGRAHKAHVAQQRAALKAKDVGAKDAQAFRALLRRKYGNFHVAWHNALDNDGNGRVSRNEFYGAARAIGYVGDLRGLWNDLDPDGSGMITLNEIAPEECAAVEGFFVALERDYGSVWKAWKQGLDTDGSNRLTEEEFLEACDRMGVNPRITDEFGTTNVFRCLDSDGTGAISLDELDPEAAQAIAAGEIAMLEAGLVGRGKKVLKNQANFQSMQGLRRDARGKAERERLQQEDAARKAKDVGAKTAAAFRTILIHRFGSIVRGWRRVLDKYEVGRLSFVQFCDSCRKMGYTGNLKDLWADLNKDGGGFIELEELDPASSRALKAFQKFLHHYKSLDDAWDIALDTDRSHRLDYQEFVDVLSGLGFEEDIDVLYHALDLDGGGFLTKDELAFLWKWAPEPRDDTWRPQLKAKLRRKAQKRALRAAPRLPRIETVAPMTEPELVRIAPLLRQTLADLPPPMRSASAPRLGQTWTEWATQKDRVIAGSPQNYSLFGRSYRIQ